MDENYELAIMQLISCGGEARSLAIKAIRAAREEKFEEADSLIEKSIEKMNEAHQAQTELLFAEANNNTPMVSLLMVHAQDHVMNAITVKDLAIEMIAMMKKQKGVEQ